MSITTSKAGYVVHLLAWGFALLYTFMTAHSWYITLRTLGLSSLRFSLRIFRVSLQAGPIREFTGFILINLIIIFLLLRYGKGSALVEVLPVKQILFVFFMTVLLYFVPPAALALTSSTDRQLRWALELKGRTRGYRVISLLDTRYMVPKPSVNDVWSVMSMRSLTLVDILRTSDSTHWQQTVKEIVGISPIVIVDTRESTHAVLFEASLMLTPEHIHKAIFVIENDGRCPVFERLIADGFVAPDRLVSVVRENQLEQLLRKTLKKGNLPQTGRFISVPRPIGEIIRLPQPREEDKTHPAPSS
jgi:hypothetical protein